MIKNNLNLRILTDSGYCDFDGIVYKGEKEIFNTILEDGYSIETTSDHKVFLSDLSKKDVMSLVKGDLVNTTSGTKKVIDVIPTGKISKVYDIINAGSNYRYYANDILVSNCQFISSDDTLIDSMVLANMKPKEVLFWIDDIKWFETPKPNHIYGIGWDPSVGSGNDNAAIQVYDFTDMEQVAEWKDPNTPCDKQVEVLLKILYFLYQEMYSDPDQENEPEIYWTVETNGVGEGAIMAIKYTGEENFPGYFISEKIGRGNKGFNTNARKKLTSCSILKRLVETGKLKINSKSLISEFKNFVSNGKSYEAKYGEHDDLVMATIIVIRILQRIYSWDEELENKLSTDINIDEMEINPILNNNEE